MTICSGFVHNNVSICATLAMKKAHGCPSRQVAASLAWFIFNSRSRRPFCEVVCVAAS